MTNFRLRPKDQYLHTATWEDLFKLGEHWQSELTFYKDETRFLTDLFNKYFMKLVEDEGLQNLQILVKQLSEFDLAHKLDLRQKSGR